VVSPDKISPCTIGLCGPLHGGYQNSILEDNILEDSILEDSILGQHIRLASRHMLVLLANYKYVTPTPQVSMALCEK
jgi:hypothetical protein